MEGGKMVTVKIVPFSMPLSHVWEGLGGKFEGGNVKLLEGRKNHWSGLWYPHVRYFTFEGRRRKMPSVSGFHSVGKQCIRVVRGTTFVLIVVIVQWPICVRLIATTWTTACQASLSLTISWVCPSSCSFYWWCHPAVSFSDTLFSFFPWSFPASETFQWVVCSHQMTKILELHLQLYVNSNLYLDPHPAAYWLWELR